MAPPESHRSNPKTQKVGVFVSRRRIEKQRKYLPIASAEERLVEEVRKNAVLIIVGESETGRGRTTQFPQFQLNAGFCREGKVIRITQPRRVAAVTVAKRVAEEYGTELGQKVGYSITFEDITSTSTRIKFMTDGHLVREALLYPYRSRYIQSSLLMKLMRTVNTDVLLGLLKSVHMALSASLNHHQNFVNEKIKDYMLLENGAKCFNFLKQDQGRKFPPLKLIIMSASMDACDFSEYFGAAKAVHEQGRPIHVDNFYTYNAKPDRLEAAFSTMFTIHREEGPGDILVFLTGQEQIESAERFIKDLLQRLPKIDKK